MRNKLRTAAVATAAAVAGTTLALVGGLPASADRGDGTPGTEWCDNAAEGSGWHDSTEHFRGHNDHMGDHMGAGMGFDEMNPGDHTGTGMGMGADEMMNRGDHMGMGADEMMNPGDHMGRSGGRSMDRGRTMGR